MAAPKKNNAKAYKRNEIILLSVSGLSGIIYQRSSGFVLAILGIVAYNLPKLTENNPLYAAQKGFASFLGINGVVDFRILGTVIFLVATIFIIIVLRHYANKYDAIKSKKERRKQMVQDFLSTPSYPAPAVKQEKTAEDTKKAE